MKRLEDSAPERTRLIWESEDEAIATVKISEGKCTLTPVSPGKVRITCRAEDDDSIRASVEIEILIPVTEISGIPANITLHSGGPEGLALLQLAPKLIPEETTTTRLLYSSSDESVVTADENGRLFAVGYGTATITVTPDESGANVRASCRVTVYPAVHAIGNVPVHTKIRKNGNLRLQPSVEPARAEKRFRYESSDPEVASVTGDGYIKAKKCGVAVVTVTAEDGSGVSTACEVRVTQDASLISSPERDIWLFEGQSRQWNMLFSPEDTTNTQLWYEAEDSLIAETDGSGVITAKAPGKTTVRAGTTDGTNKSVTCTVHVEPRNPITLLESAWNGGTVDLLVWNDCLEKQIVNVCFEIEWIDSSGILNWGSYSLDTDLATPIEPRSAAAITKKVSTQAVKNVVRFRFVRVRFADGSVYDIP